MTAPKPPAPDHKDREAVAEWVRAHQLQDPDIDYEGYELPDTAVPDFTLFDIHRLMEKEAVAKANQGNFKLLAQLVDPGHLLNKHPIGKPPIRVRDALSEQTWALIAVRLANTFKAKVGGQTKTPDERRRAPGAAAASWFPLIKRILSEAYPEQKAKDVRDLALYVTEHLFGLNEGQMANQVTRSKRHKARTKRHKARSKRSPKTPE